MFQAPFKMQHFKCLYDYCHSTIGKVKKNRGSMRPLTHVLKQTVSMIIIRKKDTFAYSLSALTIYRQILQFRNILRAVCICRYLPFHVEGCSQMELIN